MINMLKALAMIALAMTVGTPTQAKTYHINISGVSLNAAIGEYNSFIEYEAADSPRWFGIWHNTSFQFVDFTAEFLAEYAHGGHSQYWASRYDSGSAIYDDTGRDASGRGKFRQCTGFLALLCGGGPFETMRFSVSETGVGAAFTGWENAGGIGLSTSGHSSASFQYVYGNLDFRWVRQGKYDYYVREDHLKTFTYDIANVSISAVPLPGAGVAMLIGLGALSGLRKKARKAR